MTVFLSIGGEKVLLNHKQESLADHVDVAEVLKCLNISAATSSEENAKNEMPNAAS